MHWKTLLLLVLLALGTFAGYGSALARARHCHRGSAPCGHVAMDKPAATP